MEQKKAGLQRLYDVLYVTGETVPLCTIFMSQYITQVNRSSKSSL